MAQDGSLSIEDALKKSLSRDLSYDLKVEESLSFEEPPQLPGEIVQGVLRFGHKLLLVGPADCGKTSLLLTLALSVAQGKPWLGLQTQACHVLYVNLELEAKSFVHRIHQLAKVCDLSACDKNFHFINHRGGNLDPLRFGQELRQILVDAKLQGILYRLVIIDPAYKLIGLGGSDESSNQRASRLITGLGAIAEFGEIAFAMSVDVYIDGPRFHVTNEVENGIGQLARDADSLLTLWPLERHDNAFRLKGQMREFEAFKPTTLEFEYPIFRINPDLDRVPIIGTLSATGAPAEDGPAAEVNVWKMWDSLGIKDTITIDQLAKSMSLTAFDVRRLVLQAGPHPQNPNLKLRMVAGGKVKAEEDQ